MNAWHFMHPGVGPNFRMMGSVMRTRFGACPRFLFMPCVKFILRSKPRTFSFRFVLGHQAALSAPNEVLQLFCDSRSIHRRLPFLRSHLQCCRRPTDAHDQLVCL